MRFFYNNLVDASAASMSASSAISTLPASNVQTQLIERVWRTTTAAAAEYITADLGSAQAVTAFLLQNHNLLVTEAMQLEADNDPAFGSATLYAVTWAAGTIARIISSNSKRYWKYSFTKTSAAVQREAGRLFLGTYADTTEQPDFGGWESDPTDLSVAQRSRGGQVYSDIRSSFRTLRLDFSMIGETDKATIEAVATACGTHTSFFIQVDPANSPLTEYLYVNFKRRPKFKVSGYDSELKYDTTLELEEQL